MIVVKNCLEKKMLCVKIQNEIFQIPPKGSVNMPKNISLIQAGKDLEKYNSNFYEIITTSQPVEQANVPETQPVEQANVPETQPVEQANVLETQIVNVSELKKLSKSALMKIKVEDLTPVAKELGIKVEELNKPDLVDIIFEKLESI